MTKDELKREAEKFLGGWFIDPEIVKLLVDFAEPREKRIEEIENYFVESAGYGRDKVRNFMDIVNRALEQKGERIEELEKENARLKEINTHTLSQLNLDNGELITELTKAKEIIKTFCGFCSVFNSTNGSFDNLIAQAEKFLDSEVEK